jgi:hypothetical protein
MRQIVNTTIPVGGARSGSINCNESSIVAILSGSNPATTTFSLLVSTDGSKYYYLRDNSSEYSMTVLSGSFTPIYINPIVTFPFNAVQIHQGTSASPVFQTGSPLNLTIVLQRV